MTKKKVERRGNAIAISEDKLAEEGYLSFTVIEPLFMFRPDLTAEQREEVVSELHRDAVGLELVPSPQDRGEGFPCPNGCGRMEKTRCKLKCPTCGYFDSCSDFQ